MCLLLAHASGAGRKLTCLLLAHASGAGRKLMCLLLAHASGGVMVSTGILTTETAIRRRLLRKKPNLLKRNDNNQLAFAA